MSLGDRLTRARKAAGLTADEVAEATGLSRSFVYAVERGDCSPTADNLLAICEALDISVDWALRGRRGKKGQLEPVTDEERQLLAAVRRLGEGDRRVVAVLAAALPARRK